MFLETSLKELNATTDIRILEQTALVPDGSIDLVSSVIRKYKPVVIVSTIDCDTVNALYFLLLARGYTLVYKTVADNLLTFIAARSAVRARADGPDGPLPLLDGHWARAASLGWALGACYLS